MPISKSPVLGRLNRVNTGISVLQKWAGSRNTGIRDPGIAIPNACNIPKATKVHAVRCQLTIYYVVINRSFRLLCAVRLSGLGNQ